MKLLSFTGGPIDQKRLYCNKTPNGTHVFWWTRRVHQKIWDQGSIKRHEVFGSTKRHEVLGGGKKWNMSFLGPSKDMRFHEGKHKNGPIKAHEVLVHQMKWGLKFCVKFVWVHQCTWRLFEGGHLGCGGKSPTWISESVWC